MTLIYLNYRKCHYVSLQCSAVIFLMTAAIGACLCIWCGDSFTHDYDIIGLVRSSCLISRDREPRDKGNVNNNSNIKSSSSSSGVLSAPGPGQTMMVPIPGPDGNIFHVQLSKVIPPAPAPPPHST